MTAAVRALTMAVATLVLPQALGAAGGLHSVRYLMGTWCDLVIFDPPADSGAAEAAFREIARLEDILSSWDPASEVSRLNANAGHGSQTVSDDLAAVAAESAEMCAASGGAFDASVGPLLRVWGFYTDSPTVPAADVGRAAAAQVGCDRVSVQRESRSIAVADGAALDFGSIGKGYAVDRALAILRARGVARAKVDLGSSSIGFLGKSAEGWPVVIANPLDREQPLISFRIAEGSVSTSGQRERYFERDGRRYGHIFDPRTGRPVESQLLSVTVIASQGSSANAWSTSLAVLGATEGKRLISRAAANVSAVFVEDSRSGLVISTAGKPLGLTRMSH